MQNGILALLFISSLVSVFSFKREMTYEDGTYFGEVIVIPTESDELKSYLPNGFGTWKSINGRMYTGNWVRGKRSGHGKTSWYHSPIFEDYEGKFLNNYRHGKGISRFINGSTYITYSGDHEYGKISGVGLLTRTADKVNYKHYGEFRDNLAHGFGVLFISNGLSYNGTWIKSLKDGQFVVLAEDINNRWIHECSYRNDLLQGEGKILYANGTIEIQHWNKGRRNGEQVIQHPNGYRETKMWNNNLLEGDQIIKYHTNLLEIQTWVKGLRHGEQVIELLNGGVESQMWIEGRREGYQVIKYPDDRIAYQKWENNQRIGMLIEEWSDGSKNYYEWIDGDKKYKLVKTPRPSKKTRFID